MSTESELTRHELQYEQQQNKPHFDLLRRLRKLREKRKHARNNKSKGSYNK